MEAILLYIDMYIYLYCFFLMTHKSAYTFCRQLKYLDESVDFGGVLYKFDVEKSDAILSFI